MIETAFCMGSNMDNRLGRLRQAKTRILLDPQVKFLDQSFVYETEPVDVKEEYRAMKFLNSVLVVESPYEAEEWLPKIKEIEQALGRVRTADRNAPRTIDVDILYCGERVVEEDLLQIPHPRWKERRFVMQPLADVRPERILPGCSKPVREILEEAEDPGTVRLFAETW